VRRTHLALALALFTLGASGQGFEGTQGARDAVNDAEPAGSRRCDLMALEPKPGAINLRQSVVPVLQGVATCLAREDARCADDLLSQVDPALLGGDEEGLLLAARARVASLRKDHDDASELFRQALGGENVGPQAKAVIAQQYAANLLAQSDFASALRVLDAAFDCDTWTAQALVTRAAAYLRIFAAEPALANLEAAARLYGAAGRAPPPEVETLRQQLADARSAREAAEAGDENAGTGLIPVLRLAPDYPRRALDRGLPGCVRAELSISDNGTVEDVRVLESSDKMFEEPAIDTFKKWRYAPPLEDGLPVSTELETVLRWQLDRSTRVATCGESRD